MYEIDTKGMEFGNEPSRDNPEGREERTGYKGRRPLGDKNRKDRNMTELDEETLRRLYWEENESTETIARRFNLNSGTIYRRMVEYGIPTRSKKDACDVAKKENRWSEPPHHFIEPDFSNKNILAYILGVIRGDGYTNFTKNSKSGKVVFANTSKEFVKEFQRNLEEINLNPSFRKVEKDRYKQGFVWRLEASSYKFVKWYQDLSLEEIEELVRVNEEREKEFLRGFYESEGTNYISPQGAKGGYDWHIAIAGKGKKLYDLVEKVLEDLGFDFGRYYWERKDVHKLYSSDQRRNYRFINKIQPVIKNETIQPAEEQEEWTTKKVKERLREFVEENGYSPSSRDVSDSLRGACERHFGSWNKAKEEARIKSYEIGHNRKAKNGKKPGKRWSKKKVIRKLKEKAREVGRSPVYDDVSASLSHACKRYFGSWNEAKRAAGLKCFSNRKNEVA